MTTTDVTTASLSKRLREETSQAHADAEQSQFLAALLSGQLSVDAWYGLLCQYQYIYAALESAIAGLLESRLTFELFAVELDRSEHIAHDLALISKRYPVTAMAPQPSTLEYVARIQSCRNSPLRLLAHHYTLYLGDLSGGQVMRTLLQRHYGLLPDELTFFKFDIGSLPLFKRRYRNELDALAITAAEADSIIVEAAASFAHNQHMFEELCEIYAPQLRLSA